MSVLVATTTTVTVSVTLNVHDVEEFRLAAYQRALADGLDEDDAREYTNPESKSLGECASMIIDPGLSPNGCDIVSSDWNESTY